MQRQAEMHEHDSAYATVASCDDMQDITAEGMLPDSFCLYIAISMSNCCAWRVGDAHAVSLAHTFIEAKLAICGFNSVPSCGSA